MRELADDLGYVSLAEVTGRHSCEALGRADFSATDLAPSLMEAGPYQYGVLADAVDLGDPSGEDLARAASRWVRQVLQTGSRLEHGRAGSTWLNALAQGTWFHIAGLQNTAIVVLNGQSQRLQKLRLRRGSGAVWRPHPAHHRRLRGPPDRVGRAGAPTTAMPRSARSWAPAAVARFISELGSPPDRRRPRRRLREARPVSREDPQGAGRAAEGGRRDAGRPDPHRRAVGQRPHPVGRRGTSKGGLTRQPTEVLEPPSAEAPAPRRLRRPHVIDVLGSEAA